MYNIVYRTNKISLSVCLSVQHARLSVKEIIAQTT